MNDRRERTLKQRTARILKINRQLRMLEMELRELTHRTTTREAREVAGQVERAAERDVKGASRP